MKNFTLLFTAILMSLATLAQAPQGINYQTVIRDGDGNIMPDTELSLQMSIRTGAPDGDIVYQETHDATTNAFGLVNLVVGSGTPQSGTFADIAWGDDAHYLETAIDPNGGSSYTVLGVTQFLSVPYANYSQKAATMEDGANPGEMLYWDGEAWVAILPGEHDQTLRLCNGVPTWGVCHYNLTLISDPAEAGTVSSEGQYEAGEQVSITADVNPGWEFVNWTDDDGIVSEVANFTYTMPAEDVTLTANFVEEQVSFTCGDQLIDARDGQTYETVQIGEQCWMAENLNVGTRITGTNNQTDNGTIEKYCFYDDPANCETYGGLYQWNEMMQYTTTAGVQGICPEGWHLPTDAEWCTLEQEVDPTITCSSTGWRGVDGGGKLKESGTTHWNSPNTGATNSSGFTALPGGNRNIGGSFGSVGHNGYWWSSSRSDGSSAWGRYLHDDSAQVVRHYLNKSYGFSVRCLKGD